MTRTRKRLIGIGLCVAIGLVAAELGVRQVAMDRFDAMLERHVARAIGASVSVDALVISLLPRPHLEARGFRAWGFGDDSALRSLEIRALELGIAWRGLLRRSILIRSLEIEGAEVIIAPEGELLAEAQPELLVADSDRDPLRLQLRRFSGTDLLIAYRERESGNARSLQLESLELEAQELESPVDFAVAGTLDGTRFDLEGRIGSVSELLAPSAPFPVALEGRIFEAAVAVEGTLARPTALEGIDLAVTATLPGFRLEDWELPPLGLIHVRARISDLDGTLGIESLSIASDGRPLHLDVSGEIDDVRRLAGIAVDAVARITHLEFPEPIFGFRIPAIESASITAAGRDADGTLGIDAKVSA